MLENEAKEQYQAALKLGRKTYREDVHNGRYPYLQVLDEILDSSMIAGQVHLGLIEIPSEMIVGTKTRGRTAAFSSNYMPLLPDNSEFAMKWCHLCSAHLGDEGIRDPIRCYEYLGRFYVLEGNKRVSVLKSYGAPTITGQVTRVVPVYSKEKEIRLYYEFLDYYPLTKLYQLKFTQPASFPKLQAAMGFEADHKWSGEERAEFLSYFYKFNAAFQRLSGDLKHLTAADALIVWLRMYSYESLADMSAADILNTLQPIWQDVKVLDHRKPISVNTEADTDMDMPEQGIFGKLMTSMFPTKLKVAFIHELDPKVSNWIRAHEEGRHIMEQELADSVETMVYSNVGTEDDAEDAMLDAISKGAQVIFTTTAPLIALCRKIALLYPNVKILNCSISMPYTGVRTYYSRIYEGKFISGAIAGAMSRSDEIGYVANYPIFGVPAEINAFALGAQLTNPLARIKLKWSCVPGDPLDELRREGVNVVSTLDIPLPGWEKGKWGTFRMNLDGSTEMLASPYWNWGTFYINLIRSILNGSWDSLNANKEDERAVNYWWGMASGVIGIKLTDAIPYGVRALTEILQNSIINDSVMPFHRHIRAQNGSIKNDGEKYFSFDRILHMNWLCDNVDGSIPTYDMLIKESKNTVRLQGIYRDEILPEKEGVLL